MKPDKLSQKGAGFIMQSLMGSWGLVNFFHRSFKFWQQWYYSAILFMALNKYIGYLPIIDVKRSRAWTVLMPRITNVKLDPPLKCGNSTADSLIPIVNSAWVGNLSLVNPGIRCVIVQDFKWRREAGFFRSNPCGVSSWCESQRLEGKTPALDVKT